MFKGLASHQSDRLTDSLSCRQNGRCDEHEKINGDTNRKLDFVYAFCGFYVSCGTCQRKVRHCYYTSYKEFPPVSDQDRISLHNIHAISIMQVMWINIWYSPDRRSILGNTIPKVLATGFRWYTRPRAQLFPIQTNLGWWITFLFFSKT